MAELPQRAERVCAVCRTALGEGERCAVDEKRRVFSLTETVPREELRELSYESVPRIRWLGPNFRLVVPIFGAVLGAVITFIVALTSVEFGGALFMSMLAGLVGLVVLAGIAVFFEPPTSFYRRQVAGALGPCGGAGDPEGPVGRIVRANAEQSPDVPLLCVLELTAREGKVATLRVSHCDELVIELEDGRRVYVPEGRVSLTGTPGTFAELDADEAKKRVDALGVAPSREFLEEEEGPVPTDGGKDFSLSEGARVRVQSPLRVAPREAHGGAFRTAANRDLAPVGVLRLHALLPG